MGAPSRVARPLTTGLLVLGVAGGLVAGCSRGVPVTPPPHTAACDEATTKWPATVARQSSAAVRVEGGSAEPGDAAAWGDPAIIASCGWPALGPTSEQCLSVDGVDWVVEQLSDGVRFTTFGRAPAIEVLVPHAYAPEPLLLPAFGPAAKALPRNDLTCS